LSVQNDNKWGNLIGQCLVICHRILFDDRSIDAKTGV
jgi:hypothetical protein